MPNAMASSSSLHSWLSFVAVDQARLAGRFAFSRLKGKVKRIDIPLFFATVDIFLVHLLGFGARAQRDHRAAVDL